jgi:hypothetical protein
VLLQTPEKESEKVFGLKKNIFETFIITSRTRTENNSLRKKEILKEVFGADEERPRSAPPSAKNNNVVENEDDDVKKDEKISYDQKYREYLEKMNVDFLDNKKQSSSSTQKLNENSNKFIKQEDDEEFDDNETVVASEQDLAAPTIKRKARKHKTRRGKGSSGKKFRFFC